MEHGVDACRPAIDKSTRIQWHAWRQLEWTPEQKSEPVPRCPRSSCSQHPRLNRHANYSVWMRNSRSVFSSSGNIADTTRGGDDEPPKYRPCRGNEGRNLGEKYRKLGRHAIEQRVLREPDPVVKETSCCLQQLSIQCTDYTTPESASLETCKARPLGISPPHTTPRRLQCHSPFGAKPMRWFPTSHTE